MGTIKRVLWRALLRLQTRSRVLFLSARRRSSGDARRVSNSKFSLLFVPVPFARLAARTVYAYHDFSVCFSVRRYDNEFFVNYFRKVFSCFCFDGTAFWFFSCSVSVRFSVFRSSYREDHRESAETVDRVNELTILR